MDVSNSAPVPDIQLFETRLCETRLALLREKPGPPVILLSNSGMRDEHIPKLVEALHHSECAAAAVDLTFNELTSAGILALCDALSSDGMMAHDLQYVYLGGNPAVEDEARTAAADQLRKHRPDVALDFEAKLRTATPLMDVGKVFPGSPAFDAGLVKHDIIVAFGALCIGGKKPNRGFKSETERHLDAITHFAGIEETLKPLVDGAVTSDGANRHAIEVVVQRAGVGHLKLRLCPGKWDGPGLLGAKITSVEKPAPKGPLDTRPALDKPKAG